MIKQPLRAAPVAHQQAIGTLESRKELVDRIAIDLGLKGDQCSRQQIKVKRVVVVERLAS